MIRKAYVCVYLFTYCKTQKIINFIVINIPIDCCNAIKSNALFNGESEFSFEYTINYRSP